MPLICQGKPECGEICREVTGRVNRTQRGIHKAVKNLEPWKICCVVRRGDRLLSFNHFQHKLIIVSFFSFLRIWSSFPCILAIDCKTNNRTWMWAHLFLKKNENNWTEMELRLTSRDWATFHWDRILGGCMACCLFVFIMSTCVGGDSQRQVVMTDASQDLPEKIT